MGKQNKRDRLIKINSNSRQFGGKRDMGTCGEELQSFFACMAVSTLFAESCRFILEYTAWYLQQ